MPETQTDRIRRAITGLTPPPSCAPECKMGDRVGKLEGRVEDHDKRLGQGDVGFAELRKDVGMLTEKVSELIGVLKWGAFGVAGFVATTAGGALIWVVVQSGGKAAGATP